MSYEDAAKRAESRCDGCAELRRCRTYRGGSAIHADYCRRCDALRRYFALSPGEHEQYRLDEHVDELVSERRGSE